MTHIGRNFWKEVGKRLGWTLEIKKRILLIILFFLVPDSKINDLYEEDWFLLLRQY